MSQPLSLEYIRANDKVLNSKPQWKDLLELITPNYSAHWKIVGAVLGIPKGRLDGIESCFPASSFKCCNRMLEMCLETNASVKWKDVITAIDSPAIQYDLLPEISEDFIARTISKLNDHVKANYIKTRYLTQEGIWCHLSPRHFVNVLLIHHMEQHSEKEIVDIALLMREGLANPYQLSQSKKVQSVIPISTLDISDIFKPIQKTDGTTSIPEVIIIDGAPGMGKTTLCKEIAYRWAKSQLLNDIKVVFFIYLRDPDTQKIYDLQSFIHYFHNFDQAAAEFSKQCANILVNRSNEDIAIILDGYDEIFHASANSFTYRIVHRAVLSECKLIITSRPTATNRLRNTGDIRVEVIGFNDDSKREYIEQELKYYPSKIEKLFSYLADHEAINSICYIPMIMTILVCTFREYEELPSDQTELYEKFLTLAISRYVEKLEGNPNQEVLPLKHLPELYKQHLFELSKFAFYNLKDDKIVFTQQDIEKYCPMLTSASKHFEGLGLLKSVKYFSMKNIENCLSYNFLHLSLQEYLAASYIKSLSPCKQFELLKDFLFSEKYTNTWTMFAGLSKKAMPYYFNYLVYGIPLDGLKNEVLPSTLPITNPFDAFCQVVQICVNHCTLGSSKLFFLKNSEISFYDKADMYHFGPPVDRLALLNKLNFTGINSNKLYLSVCNAFRNSIECFVVNKNTEEILYSKIASWLYTNKQLSVVIVNVSTMIGYRANEQQISDGLAMNNSITNLILKECCIDDEIAEIISFYIRSSNMMLAAFNGCTFTNSSDKVIFEALSHIKSLKFLNINRTRIDNTAINLVIQNNVNLHYVYLNCQLQSNAIQIASVLKTLSTIRTLNLSNNSIPSYAADEISKIIAANDKLQALLLANNNLQNGIAVIASALCRIASLTSLNLSNNNMTEEAAEHLALAIVSNESIEELRLGGNNLKTNGIIKIAQHLQGITSLTVLDFSDNQITEGAATSISLFISSSPNLEHLYLGNNKLGKGLVNVVAALKSISKLKVLDLNDNDMPVDVATELASAIVNNSSLKNLRLRGSRLGSFGIATIATALSDISTLKLLDVRDSLITEEVADILSSVLKCNTSIEVLYLGNNKLGAAALKIVKALKYTSSLKKLDLDNNSVSGIIADELAVVIERNSLQRLWLANNDFRSCASKILHSLSNITSLTELDLSGNDMPKDIATLLASAIASNFSLEVLRLNNNKLQTIGIQKIATSLCKISTLKLLNVKNNLFTEEAADAISSVIKHNTGMVELYLGENKLGTGALKIVRALKDVSSLKVLDFDNNNTSGIIADELAAVIDCNSLKKLWLSDNDLRSCASIILQSLSKITTLIQLDLSGNNMPENVAIWVSSAIKSNCFIEVLNLKNNQFETNGIITIAKSLNNLSTLKKLNLRNNLITEGAADAIASIIVSNTTIKELYLGENKLRTGAVKIVRALKDVSSLKVLDLDNNNTSGIIADELAAVIDRNHLQSLWLANNDLRSFVTTILHSLIKVTTVEDLDLSGTDMQKEIVLLVSSVIIQNHSLKCIRLRNSKLTSSDAITIAKSLTKLSTLRILNLQDNLITEEAADAIASVVQSNHGIKELYLGNNKLGVGALKIVRALKGVSSLKVLDLNCNNTSGIIADELAAVIDHNKLQKLLLESNGLRSCASTMLQLLSNITTLTGLNLSGNEMPKEVTVIVSCAMSKNCFLKYLWLRNSRLMMSGVIAIAKSLTKMSTLKILDLQNNFITEEAADAIALVIKCNTEMEQLYLGDNKLGAGTLKIVRALKDVSSLKVLDLNNNNTSGIIADELAAVIERNRLQKLWLANNGLRASAITILQSLSKITVLKELDLSGNDMPDEVTTFVSSVVASNSTLEDLRLQMKHLDVSGHFIAKEATDSTGDNQLGHHLSNNDLQAGACKILAVQNCKTLKLLDLDNTNLSEMVCIDDCLQPCGQFILQSFCKINTLTSLYLGNCNVTSELAKDLAAVIKNNCSLELLELKHNQLKTSGLLNIYNSLQQLSTLKHFDIRNNKITAEAAERVSSVIFSNKKMQQLYIGDNMFHDKAVAIIKALQTVSSLVVLHLSNMKMTEEVADDLVLAISNNPLLEKLYLAGNLLSNSLIKIARACQKHCKYLMALDMRCNSFDPMNLASVTGDFDTLDALFLGGMAFTTDEIFFINFMLHLNYLYPLGNEISLQNQVIEILNMEVQRCNIVCDIKLNYHGKNVPLTYTGILYANILNVNKARNRPMILKMSKQTLCNVDAATMVFSLPINSSLKVLDLEYSNIAEIASSQLATRLHFYNALEQLWLRGNHLGTSGAVCILKSIKKVSTLTMLDLSFNNIGYLSADSVATVIYSNPTLEQLWLDGNGLLDTGVIQICRALKHVNKLRVLSLRSNGISDDSAEELSAAINSNVFIQDLLLGSNNLQHVGICKTVHSLNSLVRLRKLDLFHNKVTAEAANELAVTISNSHTLQELYLSDNMLGTTGAVKVFKSLKHKSKLQVLTLSNNNITDEAIGELCFVLANNPRLRVLLIGGNKLQTDSVITIAGVVKCENTIMHLLALCENDVNEEGKEQVKMMFSDNPDIFVYL